MANPWVSGKYGNQGKNAATLEKTMNTAKAQIDKNCALLSSNSRPENIQTIDENPKK